jgi:hypothetical protein
MKKFIAMLTLLIGFNANAGLITVDFSNDDVVVGDSVVVTINASGFDLTNFFYFDFNFDNTVMAYDAGSLSSGLILSANNVDFYGLVVEEYIDDNLLAFEFLSYDPSISAVGDFVLASFSLIASAEGEPHFSISDFWNPEGVNQGDDYTIGFSVDGSISDGSINVAAATVPEPSSMALLLLAGIGLTRSRRKVK